MCGIIAYIGDKEAYPILIDGLKRLEYRGYDSAGVTLCDDGEIVTIKKKGKVSKLEKEAVGKSIKGTVGIGHTRWATHGKPDDTNAHPHVSNSGRISMIHNGIIENHDTLKTALQELGYTFKSETDTEVLVNLIEEYQIKDVLPIEEAVRLALSKVVGAYAIVVIDKEDPDKIVGARKSSPLVIGVGDDEYFIASDASPIIKFTNKVVYLNDDEVATVHRDSFEVKTLSNKVTNPKIHQVDLKIEELEKGGYDHFMLKEIFQQPKTIAESMRGRINAEQGWVKVGGMQDYMTKFKNANRLIFVACGTSWHSALIAEYLFEELARVPVEVEYASEFRYRNPIISESDVVIALSQSGETADTLAALEIAKERGALTYGIVNVVGSSIARLTDCGSYIHAGPEIGVASTKAFTSQLVILSLMALDLGYTKGTINESEYHRLILALDAIPSKVEKILKLNDQIKYIASEIKGSSNALYLGRGYNFPVALEGALKLKEISYIHAEGYPAAEMKHGPIALIDEQMPIIIVANSSREKDKLESNIQEVKARKGIVISIITDGDEKLKALSDYSIEVPETEDPLGPLLSVIPLQLLSYHIAVMRDCNVDQPRNLAKSVTVE